ncbi:MAG: rhomboid family intramembrane serine protease, partial [Verrucomicrobiales bacterium]
MFTFQFLHGGPFHLFVNMIGLYFFGRTVERALGSRPFLCYYLICGVAGVIFYTALFYLPGIFDGVSLAQPMVGASAG